MNKIKPVPSFVLTIDWFKNFAQIHSFSITLWNSFLKITISLHELSSVFTIFSYFYGQLPKSVETKFVSRRIRVRFFLFVNWITSSDVTDSKFLFIKFHTVSAVKKKGEISSEPLVKFNEVVALRLNCGLDLCYDHLSSERENSVCVRWFWTAPTWWFILVQQSQNSVWYGAW